MINSGFFSHGKLPSITIRGQNTYSLILKQTMKYEREEINPVLCCISVNFESMATVARYTLAKIIKIFVKTKYFIEVTE